MTDGDYRKTPTTFTEPRLLIVEGVDEKEYFSAFIGQMSQHISHISNIQVLPIGGKGQLSKTLSTVRLTPGFDDASNRVSSIGIVRDADENPEHAFQSVCTALQQAGLPTPKQVLVPEGSSPHVTVFIMPGRNQPGALEDLCLQSVHDDSAMPCIEDYFRCLEHELPSDSGPKNLSKAKVQAFLASRRISVRDLGIAAQRGYWGNWDHKAFSEIVTFLDLVCT